MAKRKVNVIIEVYRGLLDRVQCFSSAKKAEKYVRKWIKKESLDFPETINAGCVVEPKIISTKTTSGLLVWLDNYLGERHDNEIHWFKTEVK